MLWWAFQQAGVGRHQRRRRQRNDRGYDEISGTVRRHPRQHAREMVVQRAALVVRIARTVVVGTTAIVNVMVMDVNHGASRSANVAGIGCGVLLARDRMLKMDGDPRHDTGA